MPRINTLICSGVCLIISAASAAQSTPGNVKPQRIVNYTQHQQEQWRYHQLSNKSVQYKSDPRYIPVADKNFPVRSLNMQPVIATGVKASFPTLTSSLPNSTKSNVKDRLFNKRRMYTGTYWFPPSKHDSLFKPVERKTFDQ